jgi:hypothetical protein
MRGRNDMTESTWDDYTAAEPTVEPTVDPVIPAADTSLVTDAADNVYDAGQADSWSDWNAATGDDAVTSAQSYFDAAATAGDPELAQQWIDDGNAQLDVAANSYGTASDYADTAASSYAAAGEDTRLLGDDAATADYTAAADTSYATDADSPTYATDADTTSYATDADTTSYATDADTTSYATDADS